MFIAAIDLSKQMTALTIFYTLSPFPTPSSSLEKVISPKLKKVNLGEKCTGEEGNKIEKFTGKYGRLPRSLPSRKRITFLESPLLEK